MRWNKIIQPSMKTTTHGLWSFSYLEAKPLNDLLKEIPDICDWALWMYDENLIKCWEWPMIGDTWLCMTWVTRCSNESIFTVLNLCRSSLSVRFYAGLLWQLYGPFTTSKCVLCFNVSHTSLTCHTDYIFSMHNVYVRIEHCLYLHC